MLLRRIQTYRARLTENIDEEVRGSCFPDSSQLRGDEAATLAAVPFAVGVC